MSGKNQSPRVTIRLTEQEKQRLEQAAAGMSMSAYIRACLFEGEMRSVPRRRRQPVKDEKAIAQLLGILGQSRIANNLNQLAKQANMGCLPVNPDVEQDIKEACAHICDIRRMLMQALGFRKGGGA
jgi:phosphoglycerate dehydrogenase-like enzyme